jgi:KRAB domain-containing zinc finger protein
LRNLPKKSKDKNEPVKVKDIYCEFCGKSFNERSLYDRHLHTNHVNSKPFKCNQCTQSCFTEADLRRHVKRTHATEQTMCPGCGKIFKSRDNMQTHYRWRHRERKIFCHYDGCKRSFDADSRLQTHIKKTHLGEKNYQCKTCKFSENRGKT